MTHEYTILVGGTIFPAGGEPCGSAIAWASGVVLALGDEAEVRRISRGDSHFVDLGGASVIPLGPGESIWPTGATLEVGGPADLAVVEGQIGTLSGETAKGVRIIAKVRGGRVVAGRLPGAETGHHDATGPASDPTIP